MCSLDNIQPREQTSLLLLYDSEFPVLNSCLVTILFNMLSPTSYIGIGLLVLLIRVVYVDKTAARYP